MLHKCYDLGNRMVKSPNVRQIICVGASLRQLIELLEAPLQLSMDKAVASVAHWLRIYDPLAPIFTRFRSHTIFVCRNGICMRDLRPMLPRLIRMLKSAIMGTAGPEMRERVKGAATLAELYDIVRSDVCIGIGGCTFFLRIGESQNLDFGITLPPCSGSWHRSVREIDAIWCHLMLLMEGEEDVGPEFLEDALFWLYEWLKFIPYAYYSDMIGVVLFYGLLCAHYGMKLVKSKFNPVVLQIEALLALDFRTFKTVVFQCFPVHFGASEEEDGMRVWELLPSYHHRHWALWHVNESPEFRVYFKRVMEEGIKERSTDSDEEAATKA
jgi:hypothetical protein